MITGFAPIADEDSRVLILGSMPSEASLAKGEYYGHPRNAFWPLISALLGEPMRSSYAERVDMLRRNGIALWDVAASCEREGSGDAAIRRGRQRFPGVLRGAYKNSLCFLQWRQSMGTV